jgi:hypothetical protein
VLVSTPDGSASGADATFTTGIAGSSAGGGAGIRSAGQDKTAPKLSKLSLTAKSFVTTAKANAIQARSKRAPGRVAVGTVFKLKLSETASVKLSFRLRSFAKKGKKRVARYTGKGSIRHTVRSGSQAIWFTGWVGSKPLAPGTYKVIVVAADAAKNKSKPATMTFTIMRRSG